MNQEDMIKRIQQSAQDVPVPDSLSPEQMGKRLKQKQLMRPPVWRYGAVAAVFVMGLLVWGNQRDLKNQVIEPLEAAAIRESNAPKAEPDTPGSGNRVKKAERKTSSDDYRDVYDAIYPYINIQEERAAETAAGAMFELEGGAQERSFTNDTKYADSAPAPMAGADISSTNVQVEGVDEGDVVKTDGSCIYTIGEDNSSIRLIAVDSGTVRKAGTIKAKGDIREFYLSGNNLVAVSEVYTEVYSEVTDSPQPYDSRTSFCGSGYGQSIQTIAETFDISDKDNPRLKGTVTQDGSYKSSRLRDGFLYTFTLYWPERGAKPTQQEKYIPQINEILVPSDKLMLPEQINQETMLVMSAVDLNKPGEASDTSAIVAGADVFYVSTENIYIGSSSYDWEAHQYNYTELLKYSYEQGRLTYKARTNVDGSLNDQFSLDENEGYLRVVSTLDYNEGKQTNSLYIFDKDLNLSGSVEELAPGEQIYSARFIGDIAYFVTYRNMDPLFAADVSDPANPKILGELKITGFSEYLHPFSETQLLGIGQETDPETGNFKGLKLSMFDIANPLSVTEQDKLVETAYESTPAWYNHKAVFVSNSKSRISSIGFAVNEYNKKSRMWDSRYVIYTYDKEKGFTQRLNHEAGELDIDSIRGVYIDNYCYIVEKDRITSYSIESFSQQQQLIY